MQASQYFEPPTRHTRSTAARKSIMFPAASYTSVAEPTVDVSALNLKTSPASPKGVMSEVPRYNGVRSRDWDENNYNDDGGDNDDGDDYDGGDDDDGGDDNDNGGGDEIQDKRINKIVDEDYNISAMATSVVNPKGKAPEKGKFRGVAVEVPVYDEDYEEDNGDDDGGDGNEGKYRTGDEGCGGSSGLPPVGTRNKATENRKSKGATEEIPKHDEDYDEDDDENQDQDQDQDQDGGPNTEDKPVVGTKGKGKAKDKRRFGGSSKGRKCFRWTPKQERAAIAGMLEIRAEGEILGDLCFEELYDRLIARDPTWNHTVSGIHNAWHRRELVHEVTRAEARAKQEQEEHQADEDKQLGLTIRTKRPVKRKSAKSAAKKSAILSKHERGANVVDEETDEETMFVSKRRRTGSRSGTLRRPPHELDTAPSRNLSAAKLFTSPAPMPPNQTVLNLPTVIVGFKRHNNSSRRTREFAEVNTMNHFWNQVVATPMFDNLETAFMVVMVWVSDARKPHYMAQHDKADYTDFVRLVKRAVDASGEEEVVVNVTAAR